MCSKSREKAARGRARTLLPRRRQAYVRASPRRRGRRGGSAEGRWTVNFPRWNCKVAASCDGLFLVGRPAKMMPEIARGTAFTVQRVYSPTGRPRSAVRGVRSRVRLWTERSRRRWGIARVTCSVSTDVVGPAEGGRVSHRSTATTAATNPLGLVCSSAISLWSTSLACSA